MVVKVTEVLTVDLDLGNLTPLRYYSIVCLIRGDGYVGGNQVSNGVELLGAISINLIEKFLAGFDLFLDSVGLSLFLLALVGSLGFFHLLGDSLGNNSEILSQVINFVAH